MSKTDKTRPWWIQLRDPLFRFGVVELHRHWLDRECDIDGPLPHPLPVTRRSKAHYCTWWPGYGDSTKIFGRSNWRRNHPGHDGRARASLRKLRADWLKTAPEDREDIDSRTDVPRTKWLWRSWYWD